jgi:hypothetical protein
MIIAGIDPGSSHLGLCIAEGIEAPLRCIHRETLPVGQEVALKTPRKVMRDGKEILITTRHSLTDELVDALCVQVVAILLERGVHRVVIEAIDSVHMSPSAAGANSAIMTAINRTTWVAHEMRAACRAAKLDVTTVAAATWRSRVAGRSKGQRGGEAAEKIPWAVWSGFIDWPATSDEHQRDAAGLCLYLVTPETTTEEAPAAVSGERHAPAAQRNTAKYREIAEAEIRRVGGCQCVARHTTPCPFAMGTGCRERYIRVAEMALAAAEEKMRVSQEDPQQEELSTLISALKMRIVLARKRDVRLRGYAYREQVDRKAEMTAKREAAGCKCNGRGRHGRECPLAKLKYPRAT